MKKIILSIALIIAGLTAQAQFYKFSHTTEVYQEFNDGQVVIPELDSTDEVHSIADFKLFNQQTSSDWTISRYGFMICTTFDNAFALDPCIATMVKRDNTTSITAKTEMIDGEEVQKIQWKNMGFEGHDAGDFTNFQVWIYTDQQKVQFRYGPHKITSNDAFDGDAGPQILVAQLTPDFQNVKEIYAVKGSGANPQALYNAFDLYTGLPDENLVMTFYNAQLSSVVSNDVFEVNIYPNPFNDKITLNGELNGNETVILRGVDGKEVMRVDAIGNQRVFDTKSLNQGVYFVEIIGDNRRYTTKLVK